MPCGAKDVFLTIIHSYLLTSAEGPHTRGPGFFIFNIMENNLVRWDEIERQVSTAAIERDISILKKLHAGLGSKEFRKQIDGSIKAINKFEKYKIKIEIAFGEYYRELESEQGTRTDVTSLPRVTKLQQAKDEIGKSRKTINKYARMLSIKDTDTLLEQYEARANEKGIEMSSAGFLKFAREEQHKDLPIVKLPEDKYRIIYADPPWKYGNTMPNYFTEQADYYNLMSIDELCTMDIKSIKEDNSVLFIWVTSPILEESFKVINSWGFNYKASFIWDKIKHNMGHYNSVRHELLLICVSGSCQPDVKKLHDSVISIERTKHSKKPSIFREIIELLYPNGKRLELFAREKIEGWDTYGNQISEEK